MRVCVLTVGRSAFSHPLYGKEAASLRRAGHEVTIIAPCLGGEDPADPGVNPLGVRVIPLMRMGWGTRGQKLRAMPRLLRLALRERCDVYQAMEPQSLLAGAIAKLLTRRPLVYDSREHYPLAIAVNTGAGPVTTRLLYGLFWVIEALLVALCVDHVFAVDQGCLARFRRLRRPASLLTNYPHRDFAPDAIADHRRPREGGEPFHFLFTGYTRRRIAVPETIRAVALLRSQGLAVRATFLGVVDDAPFVDECRRLIACLGVGDLVTLAGRVGRDEVARHLAEADCGSLLYHRTPYTEYVTHPVKLFEYMAWGLPVIGSDLPKMGPMVEAEGCGVVVEPTDPAAIAAALAGLIREPERAARLGRNGRRAFLERYHWERLEPRYVAVFEGLRPGGAHDGEERPDAGEPGDTLARLSSD